MLILDIKREGMRKLLCLCANNLLKHTDAKLCGAKLKVIFRNVPPNQSDFGHKSVLGVGGLNMMHQTNLVYRFIRAKVRL